MRPTAASGAKRRCQVFCVTDVGEGSKDPPSANAALPNLVPGQTFRQAEETHIDDEDSKNRYASQDVNRLDALLATNWPDHGRRCDGLGC